MRRGPRLPHRVTDRENRSLQEVVMDTDIASPSVVRGPGAGTVVLTIDGQVHELRIEPRVSLLDALREHLGLTGSKKGL
jgi:hypothetical protein